MSGDDFLPPCRLPRPLEEERLWLGSWGHLSWWDDQGRAQGRQVGRRQEAGWLDLRELLECGDFCSCPACVYLCVRVCVHTCVHMCSVCAHTQSETLLFSCATHSLLSAVAISDGHYPWDLWLPFASLILGTRPSSLRALTLPPPPRPQTSLRLHPTFLLSSRCSQVAALCLLQAGPSLPCHSRIPGKLLALITQHCSSLPSSGLLS